MISEEPKTFFCYSGKRFRQDVEDDEGDHLDVGARRLEPPLSLRRRHRRGEEPDHEGRTGWSASVVSVDEKARQICFRASGMYPGKDPYFIHYYRINFDGTGLVTLTARRRHPHRRRSRPTARCSSTRYSRVDAAPVTELRSAADGSLISTLENGRHHRAARRPAGSRRRCSSPRGATARPTSGASSTARRNFDPAKKYPVIENIYAGPQGSFVPKTFGAYNQMQAQAELGFIVVQIDGMGTSNRSKAFHDVAWQEPRRTPGSPTASSGTRPSPRSTRTTTSRASGSTAPPPAGRTRSAACSSTPTSTRRRCRPPAATTTGWTRSGGTSSGWAGRSASTTRRRRTSTTPTGSRASCCWSSARWTPTSIRPRRMQVVNQLIKPNKDFDLLVIPGAGHTQRRRLRRAQALRLLRPSSAGRQAAGVEGDRGRDEEADDLLVSVALVQGAGRRATRGPAACRTSASVVSVSPWFRRVSGSLTAA